MTAVNTVHDTDIPDWTYKKDGKKERIDYIAIPTDQIPTVQDCHVLETIDMHQDDEDHLPVYAHLRYVNVVRSKGTHPPLCKKKDGGSPKAAGLQERARPDQA